MRRATRHASMIQRLFLASALASLACLAACSKGGTPPGDTASPATSAPGAAALVAPTLTKSMPMAGGLHVFWKLGATPCETIELERKSGTEPFKVIATVPGTVDNKHDGTATTGSYAYRLRCKSGGTSSGYSAELTATAP